MSAVAHTHMSTQRNVEMITGKISVVVVLDATFKFD